MSKADATRWLDSHAGEQIETVQLLANGRKWIPGPRTLAKRGKATWTLDGSRVRLSSTHEVVSVDSGSLVLAWHDEDGSLIHTTTYSTLGGYPQGYDETTGTWQS